VGGGGGGELCRSVGAGGGSGVIDVERTLPLELEVTSPPGGRDGPEGDPPWLPAHPIRARVMPEPINVAATSRIMARSLRHERFESRPDARSAQLLPGPSTCRPCVELPRASLLQLAGIAASHVDFANTTSGAAAASPVRLSKRPAHRRPVAGVLSALVACPGLPSGISEDMRRSIALYPTLPIQPIGAGNQHMHQSHPFAGRTRSEDCPRPQAAF